MVYKMPNTCTLRETKVYLLSFNGFSAGMVDWLQGRSSTAEEHGGGKLLTLWWREKRAGGTRIHSHAHRDLPATKSHLPTAQLAINSSYVSKT